MSDLTRLSGFAASKGEASKGIAARLFLNYSGFLFTGSSTKIRYQQIKACHGPLTHLYKPVSCPV